MPGGGSASAGGEGGLGASSGPDRAPEPALDGPHRLPVHLARAEERLRATEPAQPWRVEALRLLDLLLCTAWATALARMRAVGFGHEVLGALLVRDGLQPGREPSALLPVLREAESLMPGACGWDDEEVIGEGLLLDPAAGTVPPRPLEALERAARLLQELDTGRPVPPAMRVAVESTLGAVARANPWWWEASWWVPLYYPGTGVPLDGGSPLREVNGVPERLARLPVQRVVALRGEEALELHPFVLWDASRGALGLLAAVDPDGLVLLDPLGGHASPTELNERATSQVLEAFPELPSRFVEVFGRPLGLLWRPELPKEDGRGRWKPPPWLRVVVLILVLLYYAADCLLYSASW